jgi:hypothetical protein
MRSGYAAFAASRFARFVSRHLAWKLADRVFPAFTRYRRDAAEVHRTIPIVQLSPLAPDTGA